MGRGWPAFWHGDEWWRRVDVDRFALTDDRFRISLPPMAGGPSTPVMSADELADAIAAARRPTTGAIGVNLSVPQQRQATAEQFLAFAEALSQEAGDYDVTLGTPCHVDDLTPVLIARVDCHVARQGVSRRRLMSCACGALVQRQRRSVRRSCSPTKRGPIRCTFASEHCAGPPGSGAGLASRRWEAR